MNDDAQSPAKVPFPKTAREFFRQFFGGGADAHPLVQFAKYGIVGAMATIVNVVAFSLFAWKVFPCVTAEDPIVKLFGVAAPVVDESLRAARTTWSNACAFVPANVFCYILNRIFVFKPGRLSVWLEFLSFCAVSALATALGTFAMNRLVAVWHIQTSIAFAANLVTAIMFNYVLRKFVIFKG